MIGVVGGTFDPVHNGHIQTVRRLGEDVVFDRVHYVLSARPPHRETPQAPAHHRFAMLELALEPFPLFEADGQEMERDGPSYTVHTLANLRSQYGDQSLCLILGLDAFLGLKTWHRWREIHSLANLVVLYRPGWTPDGEFAFGELGDLHLARAGLVVLWRGIEVPYSSTEIRRRLRAGEDVSRQLPASVLQYIYANKLYGAQKYE